MSWLIRIFHLTENSVSLGSGKMKGKYVQFFAEQMQRIEQSKRSKSRKDVKTKKAKDSWKDDKTK